tara:strand:+ start:20929 stop:22503 length:1575 start_codon:yes stop_codon:yes gene_type:complete
MSETQKDQPLNILFIITDQQRADHNGFMGNTILETPNLDRLASNAMVFENAWVSNPVCMPNRSTILTGRMPSSHGVTFNDRSLDPNSNTFAKVFRKSGYRTGLIGKSHLQHGVSKNSMIPFRGESSMATSHPMGWNEIEDCERYFAGNPTDPADFYGFDKIDLSIDHGAKISGHHFQWALDRGANREDILVHQDDDGPAQHRSKNWRQIFQPPYSEDIHSTTFVTDQTIAFIEDANQEQKPWLAWCSFPDPHHPMTPPGKWFHRYRPEDMVLPESRFDPLTDAPKHLQAISKIHPKDQRNYVAPCGYGNDELLAEAIAATYGMIGMVDEGIGKILGKLETLGIRDNTIVVFTSDHGDMMGEHSLFLKGFMHYRGTLQVPLVIDLPGATAGRSSSLASSIDLGPTLLELCGLDAYDGIQGKSLQSIIQDPAARIRDSVLVEDDVPIVTSKLAHLPARIRTVITDTHRYTTNSAKEEQLYDLLADPNEMNSMTNNQSALGDARAHLIQLMMSADDSSRGAPCTSDN